MNEMDIKLTGDEERLESKEAVGPPDQPEKDVPSFIKSFLRLGRRVTKSMNCGCAHCSSLHLI
jgi:hypothetical protein